MPTCNICNDVGILRYDVATTDLRFGKTYNCTCQQAKIARRVQTAIGTKLDSSKFFKDIQNRGAGSQAMKQAAHKFVQAPVNFLTIFGL